MELLEDFRNEIKEKALSLEKIKLIEYMKKHFWGLQPEDLESVLYEDYAYVLNFANDIGINQGQINDCCEECDEEVHATVNTESFEWICPICKYVNNQ